MAVPLVGRSVPHRMVFSLTVFGLNPAALGGCSLRGSFEDHWSLTANLRRPIDQTALGRSFSAHIRSVDGDSKEELGGILR